jgi:hypothetical protein
MYPGRHWNLVSILVLEFFLFFFFGVWAKKHPPYFCRNGFCGDVRCWVGLRGGRVFLHDHHNLEIWMIMN